MVQSNLNYLDLWGLSQTVQIIESLDNGKHGFEASWFYPCFCGYQRSGSCWHSSQLINWFVFLIIMAKKSTDYVLCKEWIAYILSTWWICFDAAASLCSANHSDWSNGAWNFTRKRKQMWANESLVKCISYDTFEHKRCTYLCFKVKQI